MAPLYSYFMPSKKYELTEREKEKEREKELFERNLRITKYVTRGNPRPTGSDSNEYTQWKIIAQNSDAFNNLEDAYKKHFKITTGEELRREEAFEKANELSEDIAKQIYEEYCFEKRAKDNQTRLEEVAAVRKVQPWYQADWYQERQTILQNNKSDDKDVKEGGKKRRKSKKSKKSKKRKSKKSKRRKTKRRR